MAVNSLATELSSKKIRVNSVSPGFIDSEMTRRNLGVSGIERIVEQIPSEHLATPQDISRTIKFLISDDARYINGADICVDGGFRSARTY